MSTLNEQIEKVIKGQGSKASKVEVLVKLGLRPLDIARLFDIYGTTPAKLFAYTFGVEIECNVRRELVARTFGQHNVLYQYEGYNHVDHVDNVYKFVHDGSVTGSDAIECVSPVLTGNDKGFDSLKSCIAALNEANVSVNSSCGLHVHVGCKNMSDKHYINVFKNYQSLERIIDTFMQSDRRGDNAYYARSIRRYNYDRCTTKADVNSMMTGRYFKVNPESWDRHHTVEFRQHGGSHNYEKISMWVKFLGKLVEYSKDNLVGQVNSIDEIPFIDNDMKAFFNRRKAEFDARYNR